MAEEEVRCLDREMDLNETKRWLFSEQVRLEKEKSEIEEERKLLEVQKEIIIKQKSKFSFSQAQLEAQKMQYDKKWQDLDLERRKFEQEKMTFWEEQQRERKELEQEKRKLDVIGTDAEPKLFFKGIHNGAQLRKRYKDLTKIYHPDNGCGSQEVIRVINEEYEQLKKYYIG